MDSNEMPTNRILAALDPRLVRELGNAGQQIYFTNRDVFCRAGDPIKDVFFPTSGMISLMIGLEDCVGAEVGMLGNHGVLGGAVVFGGEEHVARAVGQIPGAGLLIPGSKLASASESNAQLRTLLFRHEQFLLAQAQQTAACNGEHTIQCRLASWLLRAASATESSELFVTQGRLAQTLGVQRASISTAASFLADINAIDYRRGRITILDMKSLGGQACECHHVLSERWGRLFEFKRLSAAG